MFAPTSSRSSSSGARRSTDQRLRPSRPPHPCPSPPSTATPARRSPAPTTPDTAPRPTPHPARGLPAAQRHYRSASQHAVPPEGASCAIRRDRAALCPRAATHRSRRAHRRRGRRSAPRAEVHRRGLGTTRRHPVAEGGPAQALPAAEHRNAPPRRPAIAVMPGSIWYPRAVPTGPGSAKASRPPPKTGFQAFLKRAREDSNL